MSSMYTPTLSAASCSSVTVRFTTDELKLALSVKCTCFLIPTYWITYVALACYSSKLSKSTDMYYTIAASNTQSALQHMATTLDCNGLMQLMTRTYLPHSCAVTISR
eukprot:12792-Heterococcus_DN1.PRE.2